MFYICLAIAIIIPYLICGINPAIIATKLKTGKDIREFGSGNPGLTNTLRTQGKAVAIAVLLGDVLKGIITILFIKLLFPFLIEGDLTLFVWVAALCGVIGHMFPIYHKFKGGKAILVTVSVLFMIDWLSAIILLSLFILLVIITKYVSIGSIIAATCYPICVYVIGSLVHNKSNIIIDTAFATAIALLLVYMHRSNIRRLFKGTEKKITDRAKFMEKDE
ncbi:MAG: glycerol-3-phosphate 1-O-acyltransferase PlsY [Oscillospiraceae bacterium]|nr:glycerol-3-phosphate 1-O-acyltransferase PlsY [Oscillospiraceae bacterium]